MENVVEKYALENALKYDGEASVGAVVGSVIREEPEAKKDIASLKGLVNEIVGQVNQMTLAEQEARLKEIAPELLEKESEEKDIFSQFPAEGEVVTAFPPEPSKYPHIGHAKSILVNYEYAKRNDGEFILRFEDTNPELAKEEFYQIHLDDYEWLGVEPDEIDNASDYMKDFYKYAEQLIDGGHAYVCECSGEDVKRSRMSGEACLHRGRSKEENLNAWKRMLDGTEGIILRAKIDLSHDNSVMRDPTLFRVINHPHPRHKEKYKAWPTYDFENAIMDGLSGVTMRFRTKEFEMRTELQRHLQKLLGLSLTETYEFARFELEGVETSGRKIRELVDAGKLIGWDDPSLATIASLKRRGFQPKAIKDFVLSTGLSKAEATLTWDDLILHNRRVLDEEADRYFFINDPVLITVEGAPEQELELNLHPEKKEGGRPLKTNEEFYITKQDFERLEDGKLYRFMECLNFTKEGKKFKFHSLNYEKYKEEGDAIMHFLPHTPELLKVEVLMPDKSIRKGFAEPSIENVEEGDVIQFERFGFCRLDSEKKGKKVFWYTHK